MSVTFGVGSLNKVVGEFQLDCTGKKTDTFKQCSNQILFVFSKMASYKKTSII
jgi:hypothetical protein